jgi:hypothetical protein
MPSHARAISAARDIAVRAGATPASADTFGLRRLRRLAIWGVVAAAALTLMVMASRSEVGAQRVGMLLGALGGRTTEPATRVAFDAETETRRLRDLLQTMAQDRDRLRARVASLEQNLDVVGSATRQPEAARDAAPAAAAVAAGPWSADAAPEPTSPAAIAATVMPAASAAQPTGLPLGLHERAELMVEPQTPYGVDLGAAPTLQALRARWQGIQSVHPYLVEGLRPIIAVRDVMRTARPEVRLVVGPLADAAAATQLCAALALARVPCRLAAFDGQRLQ